MRVFNMNKKKRQRIRNNFNTICCGSFQNVMATMGSQQEFLLQLRKWKKPVTNKNSLNITFINSIP
jgi:hypothetical protein